MIRKREKSLKFRNLPEHEQDILIEEAQGVRTIFKSFSKNDETKRKDGVDQPIAEGTA